MGDYAASGSVPGEGEAVSNAQIVAQLQAVALAVRMFGLDAIRDGSVIVNPPPPPGDAA